MIATIEPVPDGRYGASMRSVFLRLLAFVAVLLLPFGMAAAPVEAHHSQAAAGMPMEHCPDGPSTDDRNGALADCTMACSAALPAVDATVATLSHLSPPGEPASVVELDGIELELATPPPRLS